MASQLYSPYKPSDRRGSDSSSSSTFVDWQSEYFGLTSSSKAKDGSNLPIVKITVEGYRTLGIVSTFIAGVESQCLGLVSGAEGHPGVIEVATALLLIGLLLSSFGASLALLSARWFDLLKGDEIEFLEHKWSRTRRQRKSSCKDTLIEDGDKMQAMASDTNVHEKHWKDYLVAKAVGSTLLIVFWQAPFPSQLFKHSLMGFDGSGFITFVVAMVMYTWVVHSLATAIANTLVAVVGSCLLVIMHLDFEFKGTLQYMSFERIRI
ncbi:unnamed protein product [Rhizoctonia solani]|uniref:Transmembrane protein n=1 Tax=Rhizoctonia solani TaxID=456999 RepID=A0A8H2ZZN4_9AGAM|nr:unnamed protein product [Rhizoctonia solani]